MWGIRMRLVEKKLDDIEKGLAVMREKWNNFEERKKTKSRNRQGNIR